MSKSSASWRSGEECGVRRNVQERQELLLQLLPPVPPPPLLLLPHTGLLPHLLCLLRRQRSGRQEGERGPIDGFTCRPRQRGRGESRQAVPCGASQAAVAPLRPGLRKDARPPPRRWCVLFPLSVVRGVHHLLRGTGACRLAPWGGVRSGPKRMVPHCSQYHCDGLLLVPPLSMQPPLSPPHRGSAGAINMQRHVDSQGAQALRCRGVRSTRGSLGLLCVCFLTAPVRCT